MTLLEIVQLVGALVAAGKDVTDILSWIEKRREAGTRDSDTLLPQHEYDARKLIAKSLGDEATAQDFIDNTLAR